METLSASNTVVIKSISTGGPKRRLVKSDIIPSPLQSERTLVFKTMSTTGSKLYLNSSAGAERSLSVYLGPFIDFTENPGCHWKRILLDDGSFHFESQSTSGNKCYLDSSAAASSHESVFLLDDSAGEGSQLDTYSTF